MRLASARAGSVLVGVLLLGGCAQATTGVGVAASTPAPTSPAGHRAATATAGADVRLAGGVTERATWDQNGHITFWRADVRIGTSSYPLAPALGPVRPSVTGGFVTGMPHAIFILTGLFTADSSLNSIAYTADAHGTWGAIKAERNGAIGPSGQPVGTDRIGLANGFYVVHAQLETADCSAGLPMAACGGDQRVLKFWTWNGHDFTLDHRAGLTH